MSMEGKTEPAGAAHFVGKREELIEAKRSFRTVEGRDVLIIYHQETFYALDFHCYHAGGPLQHGDIEEFDGKQCIVCPKHKYKISLAKGEGMYKMSEPGRQPPAFKWSSKGVKQRVHDVTQSDGSVYVRLSQVRDFIESDFYQGEKGREERAKAAKADKGTEEPTG